MGTGGCLVWGCFYTLFNFLLEASAGFGKTLRLSQDRGIFSQQFLTGGKPFWLPVGTGT